MLTTMIGRLNATATANLLRSVRYSASCAFCSRSSSVGSAPAAARAADAFGTSITS